MSTQSGKHTRHKGHASSKGPTTSKGNVQTPQETLPPSTSFLIHVDYLRVADRLNEERDRVHPWMPPKRWDAILPRTGPQELRDKVWRWRNGTITLVNPGEVQRWRLISHENSPYFFRSATVFSCAPDSDSLLAVPFDARWENVFERAPYEWVEVGFSHERARPAQQHYYSCVRIAGQHTQFATRVVSTWRHLFPRSCNPARDTGSINAGLIGHLPLLFAIIALSCRQDQLHHVLTTSVGLRQWIQPPMNQLPRKSH